MKLDLKNTKTQTQVELDKLELIEKKIEIRKKRLELKKDKLDIDTTLLRNEISIDNQKLQMDKIFHLKVLLSGMTIDSERTILSSEPFYVQLLEGGRREVVMRKLMEIVKEL